MRTQERVELPDADLVLVHDLFAPDDRERLQRELRDTTAWRQESITMYGRTNPVPRLTAWYGDVGTSYSYSNITMGPQPWTPALREVKAAVEAHAGHELNGVLCNLYRDGRDSVAWHSDDEAELGPTPFIASVSFGATRRFQLRHKHRPELRHELELTDGSLLVMQGPTQRHWRHQVPKTSRAVGARINLTFRQIR
ncbi:MAG: alpha-ketoglutarate-dependent dioxygenase AlkB [Acidimicrobiales bacterium]|nr:alpha-ketoglutarate-dependent dioxygenase AlkB [Acidimicrobiales bacterium]